MTVDPSDSSYTPSLIVTSIGETATSLVEMKTTHVKENDTTVKLLENVREVGNCFCYAAIRNYACYRHLEFLEG